MENKETKLEEFIVILGIEEKESKAGRKYYSVKTDKGQYSCFEFEIIETLKKNIGKKIEAETSYNKKDNGQTFKNIRKIIQILETVNAEKSFNQSSDKKENNDNFSEARQMKDQSIYTSYAKDLCIAIMDNQIQPTTASPNAIMATAIDLVKQARDSFK